MSCYAARGLSETIEAKIGQSCNRLSGLQRKDLWIYVFLTMLKVALRNVRLPPQPDVPLRSVLTTHLGHQVADCGRKSRANRQPLKRINREASFIHNSIASSGVSPRPSAAKSQVQQIRASPAMTRCRFASVPLDCVCGAGLGTFRRPMRAHAK